MGWEDRQHWSATDGRGGGRFRDAVRRVFGDGDNFLNWSFPLYRAWGITVKVHLLFVVLILGRLIASAFGNPSESFGPGYMAMAMGGLFVIVLLHEYGHCIACRLVGGEADQILLWPLGGLASALPPHRWRAALVTTLGGPLVNVALAPILGGAVLALTRHWGAVVFNPFNLYAAFGEVRLATSQTAPAWLVALWWLYFNNGVLLAFNVLLPMYPLDGGRILQELLWPRVGHRRATEIAANSGLVFAVILGCLPTISRDAGPLLGVAIFSGFTCWMERQRLRMTGAVGGLPGYDFDRGYAGMPGAEEKEPAPSRSDVKRREREQAEQAEVDRILAKIAQSGMGSLTGKERRALGQATERRRGR